MTKVGSARFARRSCSFRWLEGGFDEYKPPLQVVGEPAAEESSGLTESALWRFSFMRAHQPGLGFRLSVALPRFWLGK